EGKRISLSEMQEVADKITALYRQKGFITSIAILPPQKIQDGRLKINIIEGGIGAVRVEGNRYFQTSLIKRQILLNADDILDYTVLKNNLRSLNESRDRKIKMVMSPGQEPGTTELLLKVQDQLPIHVGVAYDNYGSRYLQKNQYQGTLTHNNLFGFDDMLTLSYQMADQNSTYDLRSVNYRVPIFNATQLGFFAAKTHLRLGRELEDYIVRGKTNIYSVYLNQSLLTHDNTSLMLNLGFDYKNITDFQLNEKTSGDYLRVAHMGLRWDHVDAGGRTIVNHEASQGLDVFGALPKKTALNESPLASRLGSGGQFTKNVLDVLRLERMPLDSTLLLKAQVQVASHVLTATEEFQLGGMSNLRGYAAGEKAGDNGQTATAEFCFPLYIIPKDIKAPFSKAVIYDSFRLAMFYDWGHISHRSPLAGEEKSANLMDLGFGGRYNLPENFSMRLDVAWPLNNKFSDGDAAHYWIRISKEF
ncbi:MAG: ShlB/FhaC/HecB family hemolysin secretion/activation protein, partial [Candidatus Omnitrophota bacterium]